MKHATMKLSLSALLLTSACAQPLEREQTEYTSDAPAARAKDPPPFETGEDELGSDEGPELNPAHDASTDADAAVSYDMDAATDDAGGPSGSGEAGPLDSDGETSVPSEPSPETDESAMEDASTFDSNTVLPPEAPATPESQPAPEPPPVPEPQPVPEPVPPVGPEAECSSAADCAAVVCVPIGITACCRDDHTCGCTWAPGAYCL